MALRGDSRTCALPCLGYWTNLRNLPARSSRGGSSGWSPGPTTQRRQNFRGDIMIRNVYDDNAFQYRVEFAAAVISRGGETTRNFDTCFEMYDGDQVIAALVRRVRANPDGRLALNFSRYLVPSRPEEIEALSRLTFRDLAGKAAEAREASRAAFIQFMADERAAGRL